jgi:hypothetical protein
MAAVVLGACSALVARTVWPRPATSQAPHLVSLRVDGRTHAALHVLTGTRVLTIGMADFGTSGTLLRVSTPAGSPAPQLRVAAAGPGANDLVNLSATGAAAVTITLNAAVSWQLVLAGGTTRTVADLRGGQVTGIALTAGSNVIDLTLPRPDGTVTIRLGAGAGQFLLSRPRGVQARVTAAGAAGAVSVDGTDHVRVAAGSVFTTRGWVPGATGFDIEETAGAARVTVTTWTN